MQVYEYDIIKDIEYNENIRKFLEREENKRIFQELSINGKTKLKATQFVGVVQIEDTLIEVLPKLSKSTDNSKLALKNFLFMLNYSYKLHNLKEFDVNNNHMSGSILEVYIYLYAKNLFELLKRNPNRYYVVVNEESGFLKGTWRLSEQLSQAPHLKHRFYVAYDEFTDNNLLNQILKFVAKMLIFKSRNDNNKKLLHNILLLFTEIDDISKPVHSDFEKIKFNRLNKDYEPIFNLAKMFLEKLINSSNNLKEKSYSFMFDMNKLFEEFIAEFIWKEKVLKSTIYKQHEQKNQHPQKF